MYGFIQFTINLLNHFKGCNILLKGFTEIAKLVERMSSYSQTQNNFYPSRLNPEFSLSDIFKSRQNDGKLWQPSEASLNFISPRISFSKQQRFKLHSIYWPANNESPNHFSRLNKQRSDMDSLAKQISKKIDQEEKNQMRMRRKSSQHQKRNSSLFSETTKKKFESTKNDMKKFTLDKQNMQVTQRLASQSPKRQSLLRDRNGMRSNLVHGQDEHLHEVVKDEMLRMTDSAIQRSRVRRQGKMITSSKRFNLNLPLNYYPGAGTYEIKRYLQEFDDLGKRRSLTARESPQKGE